MHNKLFAFNVSKEVVDIPTTSFVYDPNQQVTTWIGNNLSVAFNCTVAPYSRRKCRDGGVYLGCQDLPASFTPSYYNSVCD